MKKRLAASIPLEGDLPGTPAGAVYQNVARRLTQQHGNGGLLLITSPGPQAGRTTTAANLSLALLRRKVSVLLIEMTDSQPRLETVFGVSPSVHGMEDVLAGAWSIDSIVCKRDDIGLYLAMMKASCVLDLTAESRMQKLQDILSYARTRCDWIVIDGPSHKDAASLDALAGHVTQVLIVVGRRTTRSSCLKATFATLAHHPPYVLMTD